MQLPAVLFLCCFLFENYPPGMALYTAHKYKVIESISNLESCVEVFDTVTV